MKIAKWSPFRLSTLQELDVSQLRYECFAVLACQRFVRFQMFAQDVAGTAIGRVRAGGRSVRTLFF